MLVITYVTDYIHSEKAEATMSIKHAILGFLSREPLTGYDLKKKFSDSWTLHWSGNNNQIYRTLVELHQQALVTKEIEYQENHPPRKIYTITDEGRSELKKWLQATPELPQIRNAFLTQLTWADQLEEEELDSLFENYGAELQTYLLMLREQNKRDKANHERNGRGRSFSDAIMDRWISFHEDELNWVDRLRRRNERL
jgi:DNA-binding PadR family transcriptional regulator